jgi:hypothetical protein
MERLAVIASPEPIPNSAAGGKTQGNRANTGGQRKTASFSEIFFHFYATQKYFVLFF